MSARRGLAERVEPALQGAGANGLARRQVADIQRARMLTATVQEVAERGVANVSVAHIVARSGVSRRTFYELFEDREDCLLAAFDEAIEHVVAVVVPAYEEGSGWRGKVRAGLTALLEQLAYDPARGRLLIADSLAAGPRALERRQNVFAQILPIIDQGRSEAKAADPPPLTAEGIVGGVLSVLHARLTASESCLVDLAGPLMGMIVLPYLGPATARKEIERPSPERTVERRVVRPDPLQDLDMRLTYRTVRVLTAVAADPGSSNRAIGTVAGIGDQGQISKLLTRLRRLGLVENQGGDPARGEPNAWTLTAKGWDVHATIAEQTVGV